MSLVKVLFLMMINQQLRELLGLPLSRAYNFQMVCDEHEHGNDTGGFSLVVPTWYALVVEQNSAALMLAITNIHM
jgi:hypothetical protein